MATYTHGHTPSVLRSHRWRTADNSAAYLLPRLKPGTSLLDVGCGPGTITRDLARRVAPGRVVGVDPESSVIEEAASVKSTVDFRVGDVYDLDVDGFDVVHAHQVLQHVSDPVAALTAMRRACRKDGIVAAREADYGAMAWYPAVPGLDDWLRVYRAVARECGGEPDAGRRLLEWAKSAGFSEITTTASVWCFTTPEERSWWGHTWADRVTSSRVGTVAVESGNCRQADLARMAQAWRWWADHPAGWFVVVHTELICRA